MKKIILASAAAMLVSGVVGCSSPQEAVLNSSDEKITAVALGMEIPFPNDWTVSVGDDTYKMLFEDGESGAESAKQLKQSYEEIGMSYLVYAVSPEKTAVFNLTTLKTEEINGEKPALENYALTNHSDTIFTYQASGMSLQNTKFEQTEIGGRSGFISSCEVLSEPESGVIMLGQSEFTFEQDGCYCSIQVYYMDEASKEETNAVISEIKSK